MKVDICLLVFKDRIFLWDFCFIFVLMGIWWKVIFLFYDINKKLIEGEDDFGLKYIEKLVIINIVFFRSILV